MNETQMEKTMTSSILKLCRNFGENTTMHGVGRAVTSKHPWKRLIWIVMVLGGTGWAVLQLIDVVQDFYKYPVTTVVTLNRENQAMFPAVTICNINNLRRSAFPQNFTLFSSMFLQTGGDMLEMTINLAIRVAKEIFGYSVFHNLSDMLINCQFNGKQCSVNNFTDFDAGNFGMCHTFVGDGINTPYSSRPGPQKGLVIEMTVEQDEYTSLSSDAGVKVVLHKHDEVPFPQESGISVQPGMATKFAVKRTVTHRLPAPYGECVNQDKASVFNQKYKYTESACWKSCFQLHLYETCDCCDANTHCDGVTIFKLLGKEAGKERYCNISVDDVNCLLFFEMSFMKGELNCSSQCPPACDQTTFDVVVSTALWPTDPYMKVLRQQANKTALKNVSFNSEDDFKRYVSKNILKLEIFYESFDFIEVVTKPIYDWSNLLGDIGGNLGLWLGFSVLTALELIELGLDMVAVIVRKLKGGVIAKRRNKADSTV